MIVTGCYATRRADEVAALPGVLRVVWNDDKLRTLAVLEGPGDYDPSERFGDGDRRVGATLDPGVAGRTSFTLRCTPAVTSGAATASSRRRGGGRSPSVAIADVCARCSARRVGIQRGQSITGVHLGSYGRDLRPVPRCAIS